jgi:hypothetical protein
MLRLPNVVIDSPEPAGSGIQETEGHRPAPAWCQRH